jgi:hypothetical protein
MKPLFPRAFETCGVLKIMQTLFRASGCIIGFCFVFAVFVDEIEAFVAV